jgi:hypothetical protein
MTIRVSKIADSRKLNRCLQEAAPCRGIVIGRRFTDYTEAEQVEDLVDAVMFLEVARRG